MNRPLLTSCLALVLATVASAQIVVGQRIGVDINATPTTYDLDENVTHEGAGTAANWTGVDTFTSGIGALDLANGNAISGVTVSFATNGSGGFNTLGDFSSNNAITTAPTEITFDGAYGTASGTNLLTLTFSGLDNSLRYTLEIFSVAQGVSAFEDPDTPIINGVATTWADGFTSRAARYDRTTGATYTNLTTDGAGNLSFAIADAVHSNAIMNGAILTATASAVPEPSTYAAILGACAVALVALRRRRA